MYIKPGTDLSMLADRILYYPFALRDWKEPLELFREHIAEFWFVDCDYRFSLDGGRMRGANFPGMVLIEQSFSGELRKIEQVRRTERSHPYRYFEPGYARYRYLYRGREISIIFRRGFDYTSLYGPSTLETAEARLGIFFFRGTSSEGGSDHPWIDSQTKRMLCDGTRINLLKKLIGTLPDGGLIVTDGSNSCRADTPGIEQKEYYPFFRFHAAKVPCEEAAALSGPFLDRDGNLFTCIGHAGMRYGPTLIWQVCKRADA